MDWAGATELNRIALLRIVRALFVLARIAPGERPELDPDAKDDPLMTTLPRYVWRMVVLILEPAEAAMRRLLIIAAHAYGLKAKPRPGCGAPVIAQGKSGVSRLPAFNMFDPMKTFEDYWRPELTGVESKKFPSELPKPQRFAPVGAISLWHRINALHGAVANLKASAQRYARWKARRDFALANNLPLRPRRSSPMRPGHAPGWRRKWHHEVGDVLRECHLLAQDILSPPKRPWLIETAQV
jgi:hypothetical protein